MCDGRCGQLPGCDCGECQTGATCVDGTCVCDTDCSIGETQCSPEDGTWQLLCEDWGETGCPSWEPYWCGQNVQCCEATGECQSCSSEGPEILGCNSASTGRIVCEEDANGCFFEAESPCCDDCYCDDGHCLCLDCRVGDPPFCDPYDEQSYWACVDDHDFDTCGVSTAARCPGGHRCRDGSCVPACTDNYEPNDSLGSAHDFGAGYSTCDSDSPIYESDPTRIVQMEVHPTDVDVFVAGVEDVFGCDFDPTFALGGSGTTSALVRLCATAVLADGSQPADVGCDYWRVYGLFECLTVGMGERTIDGKTWCCNDSSNQGSVFAAFNRAVVCLDAGDTDEAQVFLRVDAPGLEGSSCLSIKLGGHF